MQDHVPRDVDDQPLDVFGRFRILENFAVINAFEDVMIDLAIKNDVRTIQ